MSPSPRALSRPAAGPIARFPLAIAVALAMSAGAWAMEPLRAPHSVGGLQTALTWRGQDGPDSVILPDAGSAPPEQSDTDQKFPTEDSRPPKVPAGGTWTLLDPQFIGPDGTPGFVPWTMTFFTARDLPDFKHDIKEPGPDSANFPNSAYTVPPGEVYVETSAITFQQVPFFTRKRIEGQSDQYSLPTLLRVGVLRNFELRLWSQTYQSERFGNRHEVGFGPLMFDSKFHFWDQDKEQHIPAFGVQLMALSNLGTSNFSLPQWEPQFSLNFDYEFEGGPSLEWNIGGAWTVGVNGNRVLQTNFQGAIQQELLPNLDGFIQGYFNTPQGTRFREGAVVGAGVIWFATKRLAIDTSYSFAVMAGSPDPIIRVGVSFAL